MNGIISPASAELITLVCPEHLLLILKNFRWLLFVRHEKTTCLFCPRCFLLHVSRCLIYKVHAAFAALARPLTANSATLPSHRGFVKYYFALWTNFLDALVRWLWYNIKASSFCQQEISKILKFFFPQVLTVSFLPFFKRNTCSLWKTVLP